jgi:hypothetical protein
MRQGQRVFRVEAISPSLHGMMVDDLSHFHIVQGHQRQTPMLLFWESSIR